jgi:hypothetical protein
MATILNTNLVYDPRYHTFESWASLMCEQYATQQLCIPDASTNWQDWASALKAIDVFTNEGIPGPFIYDDWHEWAEALVNAVNPSVN